MLRVYQPVSYKAYISTTQTISKSTIKDVNIVDEGTGFYVITSPHWVEKERVRIHYTNVMFAVEETEVEETLEPQELGNSPVQNEEEQFQEPVQEVQETQKPEVSPEKREAELSLLSKEQLITIAEREGFQIKNKGKVTKVSLINLLK